MTALMGMPLSIRTILLAFWCFSSALLSAQSRFTVNGRMKVEAGDLAGARVVVYKNGVKERTITQNLAKFSLDLDLQQNYILSFEKDGFVSKKIAFNTKVPGSAVGNDFIPFDFAVSIFKQYDDVNIVVFNQPVGIIRYESSTGDFDYDTDYTRSIQSQLQEALAAVEKKQKEEKERGASEAKAAAKAEAEAKRAAEQAARDEQARAAAAQREEQQRQAERAKAEAEARRAAEKASEPPPPPVSAERVAKPAPQPPRPPAPAPSPRTKSAPPTSAPRPNLAKAVVGEDQRRASSPTVVEEAQPDRTGNGSDLAANAGAAEEVVRDEELIVEPNKVTTVVKLDRGGVVTEFRKVYHKWGGTFYFKDGAPCTQLAYEQEARAEQLAGTSTR
ncbi:MAG: hypothetical protein R2817_00380 [Flavobacteriales bacterium]